MIFTVRINILLAGLILLRIGTAHSQCSFDITMPADITICDPQDVNLTAEISPPPISVLWQGSDGFQSTDLTTTTFASGTTQYTLSAFIPTTINLVFNGDFELGDTGFTSGYLLGDLWCPLPQGPLWCEGMYAVDDNPTDTHPNFASCDDHTTGSGNMLIANGSSSFTNVWCQDINVLPDTDYLFSAWATSVVSSSPAILQFTINGGTIGDNFNVSSVNCNWGNFTSTWNSGSETTATICIQNQNTATSGNDFAIDDIEFIEVCEQEEEFNVTLSNIVGDLESSYSIDCENPIANIIVSPPSNELAYQWEANFGGTIAGPDNLSNIFATTPGLYTLTITDAGGCTRTVSTTVNGNTTPPSTTVLGDFIIDCDQDEVTVFSSNGDGNLSFEWENSSSTTTIANYNQPGQYTLTITDQNSCTSETTFEISQISADVDYNLTVDGILNCIGDSTTIRFDTDENATIEWTDLSGDVIGQGDTLTVDDIGIYIVEITLDNGCINKDTVAVTSMVSQLDYLLGESPVITCDFTNVTLEVTVNSPFSSIEWFSDLLIGTGENITVDSSGLYTVEITGENGCVTRYSFIVLDNLEPPTFTSSAQEIDCISGVGSVSISSDSTYNVQWNLPDGSVSEGDTLSTNQQGEYTVIVTNSVGCESFDTLTLTANQDFPILEIQSTDINCNQPESIISAQSNIDSTVFSWVGPNGFSSDQSGFMVDQVGEYIYKATSPLGCVTSDTIVIMGDFIPPAFELEALGEFNCISSEVEILVTSTELFQISDIINDDLISNDNSIITVGLSENIIVEVQGSNGCFASDSIVLSSNFTKPSVPTIGDFALDCKFTDSTINVFPPSMIEISWFDGQDSETGETYNINEMGNYTLTYLDPSNGCDSSVTFNVTSNVEAAEPTSIFTSINCEEELATISISSTQEIESILAMSGAELTGSNEFSTNSAGLQEFIVTYANGCTAEISALIEIDTISPVISAPYYGFTCMKEPLIVVVDYDIDNASFEWEGPDGFESVEEAIFTAISGNYYVTITNTDNGCSSSLEIPVEDDNTVLEPIIEVLSPMCFGELGEISVIDVTGGTEPYSYIYLDENGNESQNNNLTGGSYTVWIEDLFGCDTLVTVNVDDVFPFSSEAGANATIALGETYDLDGKTDLDNSEIAAITWAPDELLDCSDCLNPTATGLTTDTWFTLRITDTNGCTEVDSVLVRVVIDYSIYTPNVFTPDDNGINDIFNIFSNAAGAETVISEFRIYDRWGNKVHEALNFSPNDPSSGWDGTFNDIKAISGVYSYYFKAAFPDASEEIFYGTITLVR